MQTNTFIDPLSLTSLKIEPKFKDTHLAWATGFIISFNNNNYLITNWHVVTGRNSETDKCMDQKNAAIPDRICVTFHSREKLGLWQKYDIPLLNHDGSPLWIEHPSGKKVDVVAILITNRLVPNASFAFNTIVQ